MTPAGWYCAGELCVGPDDVPVHQRVPAQLCEFLWRAVEVAEDDIGQPSPCDVASDLRQLPLIYTFWPPRREVEPDDQNGNALGPHHCSSPVMSHWWDHHLFVIQDRVDSFQMSPGEHHGTSTGARLALLCQSRLRRNHFVAFEREGAARVLQLLTSQVVLREHLHRPGRLRNKTFCLRPPQRDVAGEDVKRARDLVQLRPWPRRRPGPAPAARRHHPS